MIAQLSRFIAMSEIKLRPKHKERVEKRVTDGKCIIPDCTEDHAKRGLCHRHYQMFRGRAAESGDAAEFEAEAIQEGLILPVNEVRKLTRDDAFSKLGK